MQVWVALGVIRDVSVVRPTWDESGTLLCLSFGSEKTFLIEVTSPVTIEGRFIGRPQREENF